MSSGTAENGDILILSKWHAGAVSLLAERVRARGYRPVLLTPEVDDRNAPVADQVIVVDWDTSDLERVFAQIDGAGVRPAGICNMMDVLMAWQVRLAERYGIPGPAPVVGDLAHKAATRKMLHDLDISQVEYAVGPAVEPPEWRQFPAVVKPAAQSGGSAFVHVVHNTMELRTAFAEIADAYGHQAPVLVEQHVQGTEFSLDVAVVTGIVVPILAVEKLDVADEQTRDGGLLITPPEDPEVAKAAEQLATSLQKFADRHVLTSGLFHVEARATEHGPEIIEINPRCGGGAYLLAIRHRLGVDPLDYQIDQYLPGGPPRIEAPEQLDPPRLGLVPLDTLDSGRVELDFTREDVLALPGVIDTMLFEGFVAVGPGRENFFGQPLIGGNDLAELRAMERTIRDLVRFRVIAD